MRTHWESHPDVSIIFPKYLESLMHRATFLSPLPSDPMLPPSGPPVLSRPRPRHGPAVLYLPSRLPPLRASSMAELGQWPSPFGAYVYKVRIHLFSLL